MAIKVIVRGTPPQETIYRVNCRTCASVLEFRPSDPEIKYNSDQRDGDFYSFHCPVCEQYETVQKSRRP